jgi:hypothetical protein
MADVYIQGPRRACAKIELHPADITRIVLQDDVLASFTEEELEKIESAVNIERQERENVPTKTPD